MTQAEIEWAKGCNTTCSHNGICTLAWDHSEDHSASGMCTWPRSENDHVETLDEGMLNAARAIGAFINGDFDE